jgi:hypothetical protein
VCVCVQVYCSAVCILIFWGVVSSLSMSFLALRHQKMDEVQKYTSINANDTIVRNLQKWVLSMTSKYKEGLRICLTGNHFIQTSSCKVKGKGKLSLCFFSRAPRHEGVLG